MYCPDLLRSYDFWIPYVFQLFLTQQVNWPKSELFFVSLSMVRFVVNPFLLRPLHNPSIVIASEAKQSHNTLISHKIATSRHALLAAKGSLAPRNDQN